MALTHQQSLSFPAPSRGRLGITICGIVLAAFLSPAARASDDPGEALRRQFDAAKSSLATGDLLKAEGSYRQTIALGLRQLANLSILEDRFDLATRLREEAMRLT